MATMRAKRPRCYLVYALAPDGTRMRAANDGINALTDDKTLPLAVFHDHFLDKPGGIVVFHAETPQDVDAIETGVARHLDGWRVETRPLIFSFSPAAFDAQIAYTLKAYRDADWETLQRAHRPAYGNPSREAQTGVET